MFETPRSDRVVGRVILLIERVAGLVLGLVTLLIVASAIGRYLLASPMPDAFDLSRLVLGVAIAWGLASLGYHGTHIKVDLLAQSLPRRLRVPLNAFAWLVLLGFTVLLTWKIGEKSLDALTSGEATMELRLPHWPFLLAIWLGVAASLFTNTLRLWRILSRGQDLGEFDGIDAHLTEESPKP